MNHEKRKTEVINFLNSLYGKQKGEGYLVLWTKHDHRSYFFGLNEIDEAADKACDLCENMDVYYGVGLQAKVPDDNGRGQADTVITVPGLWLDIDIQGSNHAAKDLPPDKESALELLEPFKLKPTLIVSTGGGFHIFWLFDQPMVFGNEDDIQKAHSLSLKFQALFVKLASQRGWKIDNTSDLSRLLRLPGTYNHKQNPPIGVEIVQFNRGNRYDPDAIAEAIKNYPLAETRLSACESEDIIEGNRNNTLASIGGFLRARGKGYEEIHQELLAINENRCVPPLSIIITMIAIMRLCKI